MDLAQLQYFMQQGVGVGAAAVMFWIYRKDSLRWAEKQQETAAAFMAFGEKYATAATTQAIAMQRQAEILDRLERHFSTPPRP